MFLLNNIFLSRSSVLIDPEDRGYQFGDGIYEVIRIYNGKMFLADGHYKRLERSAHEIFLKLPYSIQTLNGYLEKLIKDNNVVDGIVYLQVTRGVAPRTHAFPPETEPVLTAYTKLLSRPINEIEHGIKALLTEDIRWLRCDIKSLNLLGNVLAKEKATKQNYGEAILHRGDVVTEGSSTNVFAVKNGKLYTHPTTHLILPGITRQKVIELALDRHIPVIEETMKVSELLAMDEVFITSTTMEVTPVVQIDDHLIADGKPGELTRKLQEAFSSSL